jgi:hypothetical protein
MSDEQSIDSEFSPTVAVAETASNGTGDHDDAPMDPVADATTPEASAEPVMDLAETEAGATDAGVDTDAEPDAGPSAQSDAPDFLAQLAEAMRATAGAERARVSEDIDRRRSEHIALIQGRRDAEASRMHELADEDRRAIDSWAETEQRRIQAERERRTGELEADLTRSLAEHGSQVDGRIQAVEAAVRAHRAEVDAFFAALEAETDPVRIAQQAGRRPAFPDLDAEAGATSSSPAAVEPVGVMDPVARLGLSATPEDAARAAEAAALERLPAAPPSTSPIPSILTPVSARTSGRPEEGAESMAEPAAEPAASTHGQSSVLNPMGWLRRGNDQNDR